MKKIIYLFAFGLTISFLSCKKKEVTEINNISFSYSNSIKNVNIDIRRTLDNKKASVSIYSKYFEDSTKTSKIDTTFYTDIKSFDRLTKSITRLEKIDIDKAYERGLDGNSYKIEFGAKGKNHSYVFWTPKYNTKQRGLTDFINVSNEIIKTVNLKNGDVFRN